MGFFFVFVSNSPMQLFSAEMTGNLLLLCRHQIIIIFLVSHFFFIVRAGTASSFSAALGMSGVEGKWPTCESH